MRALHRDREDVTIEGMYDLAIDSRSIHVLPPSANAVQLVTHTFDLPETQSEGVDMRRLRLPDHERDRSIGGGESVSIQHLQHACKLILIHLTGNHEAST